MPSAHHGCMHETTEATMAQLRLLEEADRQPPEAQPPEGFDSWAEFYQWERSSDHQAKR
jgi:hypothetical protein